MKILIIDRDRLTSQLLLPKLQAEGHEVKVQVVRNDALDMLKNEHFDMIMMDTMPLPSPRPMVIAIKKAIFPKFSYMMLMSHTVSMDEVINMGLNDGIMKPLDVEDVQQKVENAANLVEFDKKLRDDTVDIRTDGVIFGKKPFLHLFNSAMDRAARYGEQAFILFFRIDNYEQIARQHGEAVAMNECDDVARYLASLRRQSDFLARVDKDELVLIMQRPSTGKEPVDATERFALALQDYQEQQEKERGIDVKMSVQLVELPMGNTLIQKTVNKKRYVANE